MATQIKFKRGTRANLDTLALGGDLITGEPIYITDEDRVAICTSTTTYETFAKESEVTTNTDHTTLTNLTWTSSGHTGTAGRIAGFDGVGAPTVFVYPTQPSDIGAEPANANIQEHIADTNIHIDSSSELGEAINESTHSLLLWNGLKALKVTFARLKTWIGSYFLKLDQSTPQTLTDSPIIDTLVAGQMCYVDSNKKLVAIPVYWDAVNNRMGINKASPIRTLDVVGDITATGTIRASGGGGVFSQVGCYTGANVIFIIGTTANESSAQVAIKNRNIDVIRIANDLNVGIGTIAPKSKLQVNGGIQFGDDTAAASADKEFAIRGRKGIRDGNIGFSVTEMCMQTDVNTWAWVEIVRNEWIIP